jgi:hypothetical protein
MFIAVSDKRLYAFCEQILKSKQLEPPLHEELYKLLNDSYLKELYHIDEALRNSLINMEASII